MELTLVQQQTILAILKEEQTALVAQAIIDDDEVSWEKASIVGELIDQLKEEMADEPLRGAVRSTR